MPQVSRGTHERAAKVVDRVESCKAIQEERKSQLWPPACVWRVAALYMPKPTIVPSMLIPGSSTASVNFDHLGQASCPMHILWLLLSLILVFLMI